MADLLADENFPKPTVRELQRLGHNVETIQNVGFANREFPDGYVFECAKIMGRAVLTCDYKDYLQLHQKTPNHPGIIATPQDKNHIERAHQIHQRLQQEPELKGKFVDLKTGRTLSHAIGPPPPEPSHFQQIINKQPEPKSGNTIEKTPSPTFTAPPSASPSRFQEVMSNPPQPQPQPPSPTSPQKPKP